jgi:uncharacterized membrane protein YhdT
MGAPGDEPFPWLVVACVAAPILICVFAVVVVAVVW